MRKNYWKPKAIKELICTSEQVLSGSFNFSKRNFKNITPVSVCRIYCLWNPGGRMNIPNAMNTYLNCYSNQNLNWFGIPNSEKDENWKNNFFKSFEIENHKGKDRENWLGIEPYEKMRAIFWVDSQYNNFGTKRTFCSF